MGNIDFFNCNKCKNCYEVKEERSSELFKEEDQENVTTSINQILKQKTGSENQPKESITEREQYKESKPKDYKPQEKQNSNDNNYDNNNYNDKDGDFEEDSSFINDENSKKNSNDFNEGENGKGREISENKEELNGNENGEEGDDREDEDQLRDGGNQYTTNKKESLK